MSRTPTPAEAQAAAESASVSDTPDDKEFWEAATGLTMIRDWARARRAGPYALLGEVLLQVAARIPPQIVLPPLGTGGGTQGTASLNQLYASVGASGISKGYCHQLSGEIVAWPSSLPPPEYLPLGSGEGIAGTYVACMRDENKRYVMTRLAWSAIFAATEVDRMAGLMGRKSATLAGVLRSVWSGEPIGEANASEERRRYVPRHGYRAGITVHVQPGRGGALLSADEAAAGTPQRILWLPATDPDIPDLAPDLPHRIEWAPPQEVTVQAAEIQARGLDELGRIDLAVMPVCPAAVEAIDRAAVARHRGETGALDGHALLVREKLAAVLGVFLGHFGVTDDDWALAGHLMAVSGATRRAVADELRRATELENEARGKAEARRALVVDAAREAAMIAKARKRIRDLLGERKEWVAGGALRRSVTTAQREYLDDAIKSLIADGEIAYQDTARGDGREYRLASRQHPSTRQPGADLHEQSSTHPVNPRQPRQPGEGDDPKTRRSGWGDGETRRSGRGDGGVTAGLTDETAGQRRVDALTGVTAVKDANATDDPAWPPPEPPDDWEPAP